MIRLSTQLYDGRTGLLVVKQLDDEDMFRHQVRWLTRNRGPGLVEIVRVRPAELGYATRFAGAHTLATWGRDPSRAHPVVVSVATVLHRLHRRGHYHGGLSLDHVVIGSGGPVLVSPRPATPGRAAPGPAGDLVELGRAVSNLGLLWRHTGTADVEAADLWVAVGHEIVDCRPGERARLAGLLAHLDPQGR
jgi:hypothetical protein